MRIATGSAARSQPGLRVTFHRTPAALLLFPVLLLTIVSCTRKAPNDAVLMKVHALQQLGSGKGVAVILKQVDGAGHLSIHVNESQALEIYRGRHEEQLRHDAHDLMASMLQSLKARVDKILIADLQDQAYQAEIHLRQGNNAMQLDADPSEALALAIRLDVPVFASPHLVQGPAEAELSDALIPQVRVKSWGFTVQPLSGTLRRYFDGYSGVLVTHINPETPAARCGMIAGDLILRIDGKEVDTLDRFTALMSNRQQKDDVRIEFLRDHYTSSVTLSRTI